MLSQLLGVREPEFLNKLWLDYQGIVVRFPTGVINVFFSVKSRLALGSTNSYSGIKRQEREGDISPLFNAEVKNSVAIHFPVSIHGVVLN
jgi:hypothetical protein